MQTKVEGRPLSASAIRVDKTSSRNKVVSRGQAKSEVLLKPSCRDRGATRGQSKCQPKSKSTKRSREIK